MITSENIITDKTTSICYDVGLYFAKCLIQENTSLSWGFKLKPKSYIHYGQPILYSETSKVDLNPRSIFEMKARKFLDGNTNKNDGFQVLFEVWNTLLQ